MLRTTRIDSSSSRLDLVGLLRQSGFFLVADQIRQICHLQQHPGERLPHFIVQFARDQPPLFFLRLKKTGGQLFQFNPGLADLLVVPGAGVFQLQDLPRAEYRQHRTPMQSSGRL